MTSILHPEEFKNVEAWIQHIGKEIMRDDADLNGLATLIMTHAFGRTPLPPEVAGVLAISHLFATAKPEDRQGIRQLATAWFTDQPSTVTDPARWSVRSAARLPAAPSIPLAGHSSRCRTSPPSQLGMDTNGSPAQDSTAQFGSGTRSPHVTSVIH